MTAGGAPLSTQVCWYVLMAVWTIAGLRKAPQVRTQPRGERFIHVSMLVIGWVLIFVPRLNLGFLGRPFLNSSKTTEDVGLALTAAGIAFAIWARLHLGANWSATPGVQQGHHLVRSGPYAIVRHPIYSGLLLALLGTGITIDSWRCLLGLVIVGLAWHVKSRTEEHYMEQEFGGEYDRYKSEVKALIPFLL